MIVLNKIFDEIRCWIDAVCEMIPGRTGFYIRRFWIGSRLGDNGGRLLLGRHCVIESPQNIFIGPSVAIGSHSHLSATNGRLKIGAHTSVNRNAFVGADSGEIEIGQNVLIAMNVVIRASNHRFDQAVDVPIRLQGHVPGKILIGDNVWIGANVTVVSGSSIGSQSVIAAGAVVTGDIPPHSLAAGVPARVIRSLNS